MKSFLVGPFLSILVPFAFPIGFFDVLPPSMTLPERLFVFWLLFFYVIVVVLSSFNELENQFLRHFSCVI